MGNLDTFSHRCERFASEQSTRPALVIVDEDGCERTTTYASLQASVEQASAALQEEGVNSRSLVVIALETSAAHFIVSLAAWRLGACVLPLNPAMPEAERDKMLLLISAWRPTTIVGAWASCHAPTLPVEFIDRECSFDTRPPEHVTPCPGKAIGSGGSTGNPKVIVDPKPWAHVPGRWGALSRIGLKPFQTQLVTGSLSHNLSFLLSHVGLFEGHTVILPRRFQAGQAVELIRRHQVQFMGMAPTMMQRIATLPDLVASDFSSVEGMYHAAGVCPEWVKRKWLDLIPAERIWECYGSTEEKGLTMIRGDEWRLRPRSVGRPYHSEIRVLDDNLNQVSTGEIGELYMRNAVDTYEPGETWPQEPTFEYLGDVAIKQTFDGFTSVGDMGWVDEEGYVYLADRRVDLIKSGGLNVFPAEVEGVLSEYPGVEDAVVIGLPDPDWGHRVHAIICPIEWPSTVSCQALSAFCKERLLPYKSPKTYEFCRNIPRDSAGKVRRSALRADRLNENRAEDRK